MEVSYVNCKAIPVQAYIRPWEPQEVKAPRFRDNPHMRLISLSALRTVRLYLHRIYSWHSFLLEAELTLGTQYENKYYVDEKFQWHHLESNPRPSGL